MGRHAIQPAQEVMEPRNRKDYDFGPTCSMEEFIAALRPARSSFDKSSWFLMKASRTFIP